ncbi:MAG: ABC transporter permease [Chloroflexota bacterium]|jgi:simple sugar transport system permease protein|nr:ABC transporter permease [Chloroflexota bacterium]
MQKVAALIKSKFSKFNLGSLLSNWGSVIALIVVALFFIIRMPEMFLMPSNITTIFRSISVTTIMAIGLTFTLAVGGFDLSAGSMASWVGVLVISFFTWYEMNMWQALPLAILAAIVTSMISMLLIIVFKVPDLLATLAVMFLLDGLSLTYSGGGALSEGWPRPNGAPAEGIIPDAFQQMGQAPAIIIIMLVVVVIAHIILTYTKFGRFIYATGENKVAAKLSGIPVKRYRLYGGIISVVFIGLAGLMVASRNMSAQMMGANGFSMPAISAVFIGRSVAGAEKPNAIGTFIGATLVGILENGLIMMSVPYYSMNGVKGLVLAIALASAYYSSKE